MFLPGTDGGLESAPAIPTVKKEKNKIQGKRQIKWNNVVRLLYLHLVAGYGLWQWISGQVLWATIAFHSVSYFFITLGVTAGAHRLWTHNSYKAKLPLRILLCVLQTMAIQESIYTWCRDHRLHHKYTDTSSDPHDASRGFFYSHIGWLFFTKSEELKESGKGIYVKDLEEDPVVMFQYKHFGVLTLLLGFVLPWLVPVCLFGEGGWTSWNSLVFRYVVILHVTFLVNSAAHLYGTRPYDKNILPAENKLVSLFSGGEGWHNYHHSFPWDYKTSELPTYNYNRTAALIDFFAWLGWAYDLKTVSEGMVVQRVNRTGDGSHPKHHHHHHGTNCSNNVEKSSGENKSIPDGETANTTVHAWGWNDVNVTSEDRQVTLVLNRKSVASSFSYTKTKMS